jgi:hypothetical protein
LFGAGWGYRGSFLAIVSAWGVRCRLLEGRPSIFLWTQGRRPADHAGSIQPLIAYLRGHPPEKNGLRGPWPGQGKRSARHRHRRGGTAAWHAGLPRPATPHPTWCLVAAPPRCPPVPTTATGRAGRRKTAQGGPWPLGAPTNHQPPTTKPHSPTKKRPERPPAFSYP